MNRFDRVTSLLLLLQTRTVLTAAQLAARFGVTERTIYRDVRTLENAGVPIGSEAGVGYWLDKGYHLPPISFTLDEAASLALGEKLLSVGLDERSWADYRTALDKVRAVLGRADKDYLSSLERDVEVAPAGVAYPGADLGRAARAEPIGRTRDNYLRECRGALVRRQSVDLDYEAGPSGALTHRRIEPIGLFHYGAHWHLIAWCRLREGYRDFRLDRVRGFVPRPERFARRDRDSLQDYLSRLQDAAALAPVEVDFAPDPDRLVDESRYQHGFVGEERTDDGVRMRFMNGHPEQLARWLLQFTTGATIIEGEAVRAALARLAAGAAAHWTGDAERDEGTDDEVS